MALLVGIDAAFNAAMLAGAGQEHTIAHLEQHMENFGALGQSRAQHIMAAFIALRKNAAGVD
ncbi:hypothetical protein [Maritimibacter sp. UBA3975]|uniref:hypothetical protein n=1 Tax=Maritimibacter sp. UBA3975 TaxID=1946833 RepID=UPI0025B7E16D|nr:hypothetical protein [Maritimibacter sp. UBA3975]